MIPSDRAKPAPTVVHVLDTEGYAGRESVVERLASAQLAAGSAARVVAVVEEGAASPPFLDAAREAGIPLDVLSLPPRAYLRERKRLVELLRLHDADVMHSHGYRPDVVGGSAARKVGAATVSTVHGFVGGGWKNRTYEWIQRWSLRRFHRVVGVSTTVAAELIDRGVPARKVRVVRNALGETADFVSENEARKYLGVEPGRFLVGWVGRVSREKGLDVLIRALRDSKMDELTLSVVGRGPEEESLRHEAGRLPSGVEVRWHGRIERASRLFKAFDVFVLSSRSEGTPMVLLEAMAAGVPVVATAVGGVPDVISDDEAWLVPPENPDAICEAVATVRGDPGEAKVRARAAGERLERQFSTEDWVAGYANVYREAIRRSDRQEALA